MTTEWPLIAFLTEIAAQLEARDLLFEMGGCLESRFPKPTQPPQYVYDVYYSEDASMILVDRGANWFAASYICDAGVNGWARSAEKPKRG